jgi:site-specific recombinase XerD
MKKTLIYLQLYYKIIVEIKKTEGEIMGDLIQKNGLIEKIAETLDHAKLENLSEEEIRKIASHVLVDQLKSELTDRVRSQRVNISSRVDDFLSDKSANTQGIYRKAINGFLAWCKGKGIDPILMKPLQADQYIRFLNDSNMSKSTVRMYIGGISSFYTRLERWEDVKVNPFRGAKRPKKETPVPQVPTEKEINTILEYLREETESQGKGSKNRRKSARMLIQAIVLMKDTGIRAGSLPDLTIRNGKGFTASKGKQLVKDIPPDTLQALEGNTPFQGIGESTIRGALIRVTKHLHSQGEIEAPYSPHDFRHYFAIKFYRESGNDIYRTMKALNHSSIQTTENYLRGIGEITL